MSVFTVFEWCDAVYLDYNNILTISQLLKYIIYNYEKFNLYYFAKMRMILKVALLISSEKCF